MKNFFIKNLGSLLILALVLTLGYQVFLLKQQALQVSQEQLERQPIQSVHVSTAGGRIPYLEPAPQWELRPVSANYNYMFTDAQNGTLSIRLYPLPPANTLKEKYKLSTEHLVDISYFFKEGKLQEHGVMIRYGSNKPFIVDPGNSRIPPIPEEINQISFVCDGPGWPEEKWEFVRELKGGNQCVLVKPEDSQILQTMIEQIR